MKTPAFWYAPAQTRPFLSYLFAPLAGIYARAALAHRESSDAKVVALPVICMGNLVAGGSGKTPTSIALLNLLKDKKIFLSPGFLTRGYRGKIISPERVDDSHDARLWGDEALLLTRHAPTFVSPNRYQAAELMQQHGCDAIIMDDGLQHYTLRKDVSFALIDGMMGFGNECVIPAGPLRQPLEEGFALTDAFILIGDDTRNVRARLPEGKPVFTARLETDPSFSALTETPYVAFCGIGFPDKFKATLEKAGAKISGWHAYGDHHAYTMGDIEKLVEESIEKKARLITTEKDYARLPDFPKKTMIDVLPVQIVFDEPDALASFIAQKTEFKRAS